MKNEYFFSVIVPARNRSDLLKECLDSIGKDAHWQDFEIIVVDDCSSENLEKEIKDYNVGLIKISGGSKGPAYARNKASRIAKGQYLLFLDSDVKLCNDWFNMAKEDISKNPNFNIIQGQYKQQNMNFFSELRNYYCIFKYKKINSSNNIAHSVNSYCFIIKRDIFEKIGEFDEKIKVPSIEDDDLGCRLRRKGHKILLSSRVKVIHLKKYNFFTLIKRAYIQAFYKIKWFLRKKKEVTLEYIPISLNSFPKMLKTVLTLPLGIMIFGSFLLLAVRPMIALLVFIVLIFLFIWLNYEFLGLLLREEGGIYALFGGIIFCIELSAAFLGSIIGFLDFSLLKRRY